MSKPKYTIVSTYPEEGSKNVGDKLITDATKRAIRRVKGDVEFATVWREQEWEAVKQDVYSSDAVIFACLAIRDDMRSVYPYLENIIESEIPFGVLASGTSLRPGKLKSDLYSASKEDIKLLRRAGEKAMFWGTRGVLTQEFCEENGIEGTEFTGDIAFADERFEGRKFEKSNDISRIAVSDPHYPSSYKNAFVTLVESLEDVFPDANIVTLFHGVNTEIESVCDERGIEYHRLFEGGRDVDEYEEVDLHVGFRVHGHVSALNRRVYSYLLEQDGRGAEYGLSIERKVSVPCYRYELGVVESLKNVVRFVIGRSMQKASHVPNNPILQVMAMVERDRKKSFKKFIGLENQLNGFLKKNTRMVKNVTT